MYRVAKRILDIAVAVPFLALLPVLALVVRLAMGRPVLFTEKRAGLHGEPFTLLKFRSMTNERDSEGRLYPDHRRITPFGRFMRRTGVDELPQLLNVIKGDMSLVGPRALPVSYVAHYDARQGIRLTVKPGLTGWCQVNFRGRTRSWNAKLEQDVYYVKHRSLWLDLRIIAMTFGALLRRFRLNPNGATTSEALTEEICVKERH